MNVSLGWADLEIRSGGDREHSAMVEISLRDAANATNGTSSFFAPVLGPEHRGEEVMLLVLLPGVLCCCAAALLVTLGRWFRARAAACSAGDGGVRTEVGWEG